MSNAYYNYTSGVPVALSRGVSSLIRNEFTQIAAGFDGIGTQFALMAPLSSPTFTGTPSGPTAAPGTNTTQLATTAFVMSQVFSVTGAEASANKDASGGYVGLTGYSHNFKNAAGTFTSFLTNANTGVCTYTFQNRTGTIADTNNPQTFTAAQRGSFVTLTDAATIAIDLSLSNQYNVTLGGNRTLGVPTNGVAGQQGIINIRQDNTGSRTLAYAWIWATAGGSFSALSTTAAARDLMPYSVDSYATGNPTLTIATPCVVTLANHGLQIGDKCQLTTTGALPTGLAASTTYYVHVIDSNTFHLCTSLANVASATYIATSGSQSGVHSIVAGVISIALAKGVS